MYALFPHTILSFAGVGAVSPPIRQNKRSIGTTISISKVAKVKIMSGDQVMISLTTPILVL